MSRLVPASLVALLLTGALHAEDWPSWRGPRGDGTSLEKGVPLEFSPTRNVRWKVDVPGRGYSSPAVHGDRVSHVAIDPFSRGTYFTTQIDTGVAGSSQALTWVSQGLTGPTITGSGNLGIPSAGQCSSADTAASCTSSSATSQSPRMRTSAAISRVRSSRSTASRDASTLGRSGKARQSRLSTTGQPPPTTGQNPVVSAQLLAAAAKVDAAITKVQQAQTSGDFAAYGAALAELQTAMNEFNGLDLAAPIA